MAHNPLSYKKITSVKFRAFDREHNEIFTDKTDVEIHNLLNDICNTYQLIIATDYEAVSVRAELNLTKNEKNIPAASL